MNQFPSNLFDFLGSAVANATGLLVLLSGPGLERPGYNQFAATRRYLHLSQKLKKIRGIKRDDGDGKPEER
jgi:hypothetical protein